MTISVSKHIRHRPCSSTYCNRHATQFYESLTLLFSAASPLFALHFPFDSPQIPSQTPCVQYMTRTNAENHFATLPSDSVSKWYAASRWALRRLILRSAAVPAIATALLTSCSEASTGGLVISVKFATSRARFPSQRSQNPASPIPCSINDENSGRTQIATSDVLSIVQNHLSHQTQCAPVATTTPYLVVGSFLRSL